MKKPRLSDTVSEQELQDSAFIRRLFLRELDDIRELIGHTNDAIGAKCKSCNNTWYVRLIGIALIVIAVWIGTIQAEINITPSKAIQSVAGEGVKVIMKGVAKGG